MSSSHLLEYALMATALIPFDSPILDLTVPMETAIPKKKNIHVKTRMGQRMQSCPLLLSSKVEMSL